MDLLKTAMGALGALGGGQQQGSNPLLAAVLGMLSSGGSQTGSIGAIGGIGDLIQGFQKNGLGDVVQSWIGSGANLPVDASQIEQVFGADALSQLSQQTGMRGADLSGQLAQVLPQIVDRLTPNGQVPQGGLGDLGSLMGMLQGVLGGGR